MSSFLSVFFSCLYSPFLHHLLFLLFLFYHLLSLFYFRLFILFVFPSICSWLSLLLIFSLLRLSASFSPSFDYFSPPISSPYSYSNLIFSPSFFSFFFSHFHLFVLIFHVYCFFPILSAMISHRFIS